MNQEGGMNRKSIIPLLFAFAALFCESVYAITWCHDYTMFVVTGKDADQTGPGQLETVLTKDYDLVFTIPPGETAAALQPKDVIIIGAAHSGVVNANRRIDHYLQPSGKVITKLSPQEILSKPQKNFYHDASSWSIAEIRDYHYMLKKYDQNDYNKYEEFPNYPYKNEPIKVYRKKGNCADISGNWKGSLKVDSVTGSTSILVDSTRLVREGEFQVTQQGCDVSLKFNANEISGTFQNGSANLTTKKTGMVTEATLTPDGTSLKVKLKQSGNGIEMASSGTLQH